jgi:hypothetical protein
MDLKKLSNNSNELRSVIISSSMASCYMILEEMASHRGLSVPYHEFRRRWIDLYKSVYDNVSHWKPRAAARLSADLDLFAQQVARSHKVSGTEQRDHLSGV